MRRINPFIASLSVLIGLSASFGSAQTIDLQITGHVTEDVFGIDQFGGKVEIGSSFTYDFAFNTTATPNVNFMDGTRSAYYPENKGVLHLGSYDAAVDNSAEVAQFSQGFDSVSFINYGLTDDPHVLLYSFIGFEGSALPPEFDNDPIGFLLNGALPSPFPVYFQLYRDNNDIATLQAEITRVSEVSSQPVPESSTYGCFASACLAFLAMRRRRSLRA